MDQCSVQARQKLPRRAAAVLFYVRVRYRTGRLDALETVLSPKSAANEMGATRLTLEVLGAWVLVRK